MLKKVFQILKKRWWIVLIVVGIGVILFLRSRASVQEEYEFQVVSRATIEEALEVPGNVDAQKKATLRFLAGGRLTYLPVQEGQVVKKNQTIASIDVRDLQKNLQKSLNTYVDERLSFEQDKDDRKDTVLDDTLRRLTQKSQLSLDNSVIDVELRDIAIRNSSLYTPIDGVVTDLPVSVSGVQVTGSDVFEVIDPSTLLFDAEVDEIDIGKIKVGTPVRITLDAYPDDSIEGVIDTIGLKARTSTRSSGGTVFPVTAFFPTPDTNRFRLGMNGTLTIVLNKKERVLSVPIEATLSRDDKTYVKVKDPANPKNVIEKEVQTGIEGEDSIEIVSGLTEGEEVAIPK